MQEPKLKIDILHSAARITVSAIVQSPRNQLWNNYRVEFTRTFETDNFRNDAARYIRNMRRLWYNCYLLDIVTDGVIAGVCQ